MTHHAIRLGAALASALICVACSVPDPPDPPAAASSSVAPTAARSAPPSAPPPARPKASSSAKTAELPRGGRRIFPRYRLVGYCGLTGAKTLGHLGTGPLDARVREIERRGKAYAAGRAVLPVVEIIATVVQGSPGPDGKYRFRISDAQIKRYLKAARKERALLLLNIQPGRSEFLPEAKAYAKWLREPDVGVALDPEWAMDKGQRPGAVYGHTTGAELDDVSRYLSSLVKRYDLPEKVMVYHQVSARVVRRESKLRAHPGVVAIKSVDGLGHPGPKKTTYRVVSKSTPDHVHPGFKLFFTEDRRNRGRLMKPREVLALTPRPEYVMYE